MGTDTLHARPMVKTFLPEKIIFKFHLPFHKTMSLKERSGAFMLLFGLCMTGVLTQLNAQVTSPAAGGSQKSHVCQTMGMVEICITYSSPAVTTKGGTDRRGEIWGGLVPFGWSQERWLENEDEPTSPKPWRAGANENTVLSISHDVLVEGKKLSAGKYGLFFLPGDQEWKLILSRDADNWGHYSYREDRDALRVTVTPFKSEYREWLTYEFTERKPDRSTLILSWEELSIPIRITVENAHQAYIDQIKADLQTRKILYWYNWQEAAKYCLENNVELELGLAWINKAISQTWIGNANFSTLKTKAEILYALDRKTEADSVMQFAVRYTGGVYDLHNYARELLQKEMIDEAFAVFELNASKHPGFWVSHIGLARAYGAKGNFKAALKHAYSARKKIPETEARVCHVSLDVLIDQLEKERTPQLYLANGLTQAY